MTEVAIEKKGKRVENNNLRDSECNIGEMKNILVRKFHNHLYEVDFYNAQKS